MRIPPLSVLLTWPTPNYIDPVTRGNASLIVNTIFISLVILAVALRFYCRFSASGLRFGWDDTMIALALVFTVAMTAVVILADKRYGWDRHIWDIEPGDITHANIIAFVAKLVFTLAATFTRLSLCAFYYRLVSGSGITWFKWAVHGTVAFTIAIGIAFVLLTIFQCTPVEYYWQYPPQTAGHCTDEGVVTLAAGILNIINDLFTAVVPIPLVMRLKMPMRQRIGVSVLFGLGFVVIVAGGVRTYYIWKGLMQSWDETWYAYPLWIAAAVEIDVGVICACAPALKTLLHFSRVSSSHRPSYSWHCSTEPGSNKVPSSTISTKRGSNFNTTHTQPPSKRSTFNVTAALPWSSKSRSRASSMRLADAPEEPPWRMDGHHKSHVEINTEPYEQYWEENCRPVLEIMRRQSVELASLRQARTRSMGSEEILPEAHRVAR